MAATTDQLKHFHHTACPRHSSATPLRAALTASSSASLCTPLFSLVVLALALSSSPAAICLAQGDRCEILIQFNPLRADAVDSRRAALDVYVTAAAVNHFPFPYDQVELVVALSNGTLYTATMTSQKRPPAGASSTSPIPPTSYIGRKLAGIGEIAMGGSFDGNLAEAAFGSISSIALLTATLIAVVDNGRVRRVDLTGAGRVTTISSSLLPSTPYGTEFDIAALDTRTVVVASKSGNCVFTIDFGTTGSPYVEPSSVTNLLSQCATTSELSGGVSSGSPGSFAFPAPIHVAVSKDSTRVAAFSAQTSKMAVLSRITPVATSWTLGIGDVPWSTATALSVGVSAGNRGMAANASGCGLAVVDTEQGNTDVLPTFDNELPWCTTGEVIAVESPVAGSVLLYEGAFVLLRAPRRSGTFLQGMLFDGCQSPTDNATAGPSGGGATGDPSTLTVIVLIILGLAVCGMIIGGAVYSQRSQKRQRAAQSTGHGSSDQATGVQAANPSSGSGSSGTPAAAGQEQPPQARVEATAITMPSSIVQPRGANLGPQVTARPPGIERFGGSTAQYARSGTRPAPTAAARQEVSRVDQDGNDEEMNGVGDRVEDAAAQHPTPRHKNHTNQPEPVVNAKQTQPRDQRRPQNLPQPEPAAQRRAAPEPTQTQRPTPVALPVERSGRSPQQSRSQEEPPMETSHTTPSVDELVRFDDGASDDDAKAHGDTVDEDSPVHVMTPR